MYTSMNISNCFSFQNIFYALVLSTPSCLTIFWVFAILFKENMKQIETIVDQLLEVLKKHGRRTLCDHEFGTALSRI